MTATFAAAKPQKESIKVNKLENRNAKTRLNRKKFNRVILFCLNWVMYDLNREKSLNNVLPLDTRASGSPERQF